VKRMVLVAALLCAATPVMAQEHWTSGRPDGHAPIGVMGDHTHGAGEFMASYRFMYMRMDGLRDGTDGVTPEAVLNDYMVTPLAMPMQMHMVGLMYAPTGRITLMGMVPWVTMEMDHRTRMGGEFTTSSSGIGDVKLSAMIVLWDRARQKLHVNAGISLPTGAIDRTDVTPASAPDEAVLPYPMQLGSGTVDLRPGITYLGQGDFVSWGAQASADIPVGESDREYTVGAAYGGTGWLALRWSDWLSSSIRLAGNIRDDYSGADGALNPMMVPTADPDLRASRRLDFLLGTNFEVAEGSLAGHRLAVEVGFPVYQDLDGPQLETDWVAQVGWQLAWGGRDEPH
jgi:hypothetical protein